MKTLLANVKKADVITDPFPHIIVTDALDKAICDRLIQEMPDTAVLREGKDPNAGYERFNYPARSIEGNSNVSELWQTFIRLHSSDVFMHQVLDLMGEQILALYPDFEEQFKPLSEFKSGVRKVDSFPDVDMLLDAQIAMNSSAENPLKRIKRPHIDRPQVLFAGLFYMRHPDDESTGGSLEIYRFKKNRPGGFDPNDKQHVDDRYVKLIKTVNYERNVLVLFLNSLNSLHGVTGRSSTPVPRYFVNLIGELPQRMFAYENYQLSNESWMRKVARKLSV